MKYLMILGHPDINSFNSYIAKTVQDHLRSSGNKVILHNLYKENFDPILTLEEINRKFSFDEDIQRYSTEIADADHIIFIHPDWWGQMPAIMKGWIDRVFRQGTAFEYEGPDFEEKEKIGLLAAKKATVVITTDREKGPMAMEGIWKDDVLGYCDIKDVEVLVHYSARISGLMERNIFIQKIEAKIIR